MTITKSSLSVWSRFALVSVVALTIVACAKNDNGPPGPEHPQEEEAFVPFDERTHEQQEQYMKDVVKPEMAKLFQGYNAEEFKEFSCKTCHGSDPKAVDFHMPSPELPQLDSTNNFADHGKAGVEFMMNEVSPTMAKLLGEEPWSPENQKGFGCFSCHTPAGG